MPVASTVKTGLEQRHVAYETVPHESTVSAARTAAAAHIPGRRLAKAVVLKRADDSFLVMVIPADNMVHLGRLHRALDENLAHTSRRRLFGAPLADLQMSQARLADMATLVEASALAFLDTLNRVAAAIEPAAEAAAK